MSEPQISQTESVATTPASRREILAWAFYDFANSGYSTVVLTTIYSAYFVGVVAANIDEQSPGFLGSAPGSSRLPGEVPRA